MLTTHDLLWLSDTIRRVYSCSTESELCEAVLPAMRAHFRSRVALSESVNYAFTDCRCHGLSGTAQVPPDYWLYIWDNSMYVRTIGGARPPGMGIREGISRRSFERTEHYNVLLRPNGITDNWSIIDWGPSRATFFSIYQDGPVTDYHNFLMGLLRPHIIASWRRAESLSWQPAGSFSRAWIDLGPDFQPLALEPGHVSVCRYYFPSWRPTTVALPAEVQQWIRSSVAELDRSPSRQPLYALKVESARGSLAFRLYSCPFGTSRYRLRLVESPRLGRDLGRRGIAGLTPRETEIARWVCEGKRDSEIAVILGLSVRTVGKHVEHLLQKLRIPRRSAVAAALGGSDRGSNPRTAA